MYNLGNYEKILLSLSAASVAIYFIFNSFMNTFPSLDTGAYSELGYSLAKYGRFVASSSRGVLDMDKYTYWITPLHAVFQAPFYVFLGYGLWQIILVQTIILALNVYVVKRISDELKISAAIPISLLLTAAIFLNTFFESRPDTLASLFGLSAAYFLIRLQKERRISKNRGKYILYLGISLGLSALSYPLAGVYSLFVFIYLLMKKEISLIFKVAAIALLMTSPYLLYILQAPDVALLQMKGIFGVEKYSLYDSVSYDIFTRYYRVGLFAPMLILLFAASALALYKKKKLSEENIFTIVALAIFIVFLAIFPHKSFHPTIFVLPFMAFLIGLNIKDRRILALAVLVNFAILLANIFVKLPSQQNMSFQQFSDIIATKTDGTVLAHSTFFPALRERLFAMEALRYASNVGMNTTEIVRKVSPEYIVVEDKDSFTDIPTNYLLDFSIPRKQPISLYSSGDKTLFIYKRTT